MTPHDIIQRAHRRHHSDGGILRSQAADIRARVESWDARVRHRTAAYHHAVSRALATAAALEDAAAIADRLARED